jgi:hypothetical protein
MRSCSCAASRAAVLPAGGDASIREAGAPAAGAPAGRWPVMAESSSSLELQVAEALRSAVRSGDTKVRLAVAPA